MIPSVEVGEVRGYILASASGRALAEVAIHVLLTHPYFWPYVTRGAEREVHGLGSGLASRGHHVQLLTGQPHGFARTARMDGMKVRYVRTPLPGVLARRGWTREGAFAVPAAAVSLASRADVVLSLYYSDAVGAALLRPRRPVVLKLTGTVPRERVADQPVEHRLLARALDAAAEVWVNSRYAAEVMAGWGRPMRVVPAGLDLATFRGRAPRDPEPLVVCTATPADPRKRLVDLVDAWPAVVDAVPEARLLLVQTYPPDLRGSLLDRLPAAVRRTVAFDGPLAPADLAVAYSRAWVSVAPAVHEALGLATLESLACGTPVVGARSGATTELIDDPALGRLFPPLDAPACAAAIVAALAAPRAEAACRAAAARYAWPGIISTVEDRLAGVVAAA